MSKTAYILSGCSTCKKILKELALDHTWRIHDIKIKPLTEKELSALHKLAGSYGALFSKRSIKYREWKLASKTLTEKDMRDLILREYTFLKRPVFVHGTSIFIGSAKTEIDRLKQLLT